MEQIRDSKIEVNKALIPITKWPLIISQSLQENFNNVTGYWPENLLKIDSGNSASQRVLWNFPNNFSIKYLLTSICLNI